MSGEYIPHRHSLLFRWTGMPSRHLVSSFCFLAGVRVVALFITSFISGKYPAAQTEFFWAPAGRLASIDKTTDRRTWSPPCW